MAKNKTIYLPGLNGLRAIAALGVVISHTIIGLKEFGLNPYIFGRDVHNNPRGLDLAAFGVSIFFSLSGFLITYLLQTEKDIQKINVRKFYIRRILRIWPLYYLYIIFCLFFVIYYELAFDKNSLLFYLFFSANVPFVLHTTFPFLAHYWSLGVEEQFYLIWPWINRQVKNMIHIVALLIVLFIGTKLLLHFLYPGSIYEELIHVTRFHCMMIGALGALWYKNKNVLFIRLVDNKIVQIIAWFIILLLFVNRFHVASVIDNEIISAVTVFIIVG
jgi:peptidoglycan/LPS O-acetylase OafA/YrhL